MRLLHLITAICTAVALPSTALAQLSPDKADSIATDLTADTTAFIPGTYVLDALTAGFNSYTPEIAIDTTSQALLRSMVPQRRPNIYQMPYSLTGSSPNWHRMWINTAVLSGAFVGTLVVLECLPEDATNWNRAAIQSVPPFKRWYRNIFVRDPEWDHDSPVFNYILHPYAGAVYFMSARTQGFNFWQSLLYSACISTVGWEFGIEAFMERPSYQDLFITPVVGSVIGELFYKLKRNIVSNDYRLAGSPVLGNVVAFMIDPVNEVIDLFRGSETRKLHLGRDKSSAGVTSSLLPSLVDGHPGLCFSCTF